MVQIIHVRNVNQALACGANYLAGPEALVEDTRNGEVRSCAEPVITTTENPLERVLFSPVRNANPFFHLFEALWMLAGRNDLPWVAQFNKRMAEYSDDGGKTQPAAYGHRWRVYSGYDQLDVIVEELRSHPNSRRAVLGMWDSMAEDEREERGGRYYITGGDLFKALSGSKDVPCNTHCYFRVLDGALHMTVCCRSNDALWGAHGANAVHFSILQEYMAARLGLKVGPMVQLSNNYHIYSGILKRTLPELAQDCLTYDFYEKGVVEASPLFQPDTMAQFDDELGEFIRYARPENKPFPFNGRRAAHKPELKHEFLRSHALPMLEAWDWHKVSAYDRALAAIAELPARSDWRMASWEWLLRRRDGGTFYDYKEAVNEES